MAEISRVNWWHRRPRSSGAMALGPVGARADAVVQPCDSTGAGSPDPSSNEAAFVRAALDLLGSPGQPDVDRAYAEQRALREGTLPLPLWRTRVLFGHALGRVGSNGGALRTHRFPRPAISVPVAAVLVLALSLTLAPVRGLAAQFLTIFRVQEVTPVTVPTGFPLPDLSKFGDMQGQDAANARISRVDSVAGASAAVGFTVRTPSALPAGLPAQPAAVGVTPGRTIAFTFRADKARAYLASIGHSDFSLPAKFDGAMLQLHVEPAAIQLYLPAGAKLPAAGASSPGEAKAAYGLLNNGGLALVETKSPSVDANGVTADELRDFLLSLPGLPASTAGQLRAIGDWRATLPIPVGPSASLQKTQVNGVSAVVGTDMGMHMIVWVRDGVVFAATGAQGSDGDLIKLAASV